MSTSFFKPSLFNAYVDLGKDEIGVYNTLHDSGIVVDKDTYSSIVDLNGHFQNGFQSILLDQKIIIPRDFDERQYFRHFINKLKYSPRHATFVLCLTSDCNLACPYCFEGKKKNSTYMSPELARQAIQFIIRQCQENSSLEYLFITFFGGEPLLNRKVMQLVCEEIADLPNIRDKVKYVLTTNLTLLTEGDIEFIKQNDFASVQVALDGFKDRHDSMRMFKSGNGSFDIVVKNIRRLVHADVKVTVFLNFSLDSGPSYDDLLADISSVLPYHEIDFVLNPITSSVCNTNCSVAFEDHDKEADEYLAIYDKFRNHGINIDSFGQRGMVCMLTTDISCIIDPEGKMYKCCLFLGTEYSAGDIFSKSYSSMTYELLAETHWEECLSEGCAYLPICGGGCRALSLIKNGNMKSRYCRKTDYYEKMFPVFLRDHFNQLLVEGA